MAGDMNGAKPIVSALALLLSAAAVSCEKEKSSSEQEAVVAADAAAAAVDPNLAEALAEVGTTAPQKSAPDAADGGPPPSGVFAPGQADKEAAADAVRLVIGDTGSAPRVRLDQPPLGPGAKVSSDIELQLQSGPRQGLPPLKIRLAFTAKKPTQAAEGAPERTEITAQIVSSDVPDVGMPVPAELRAQLAKLKGSRIEYEVDAGSGPKNFSYELAAGAPAGLDNPMRGLTEVVAAQALPYPAEPVGRGAYWMITRREQIGGLDVVAYRMVKVEALDGERATLSLVTKRYAAEPQLKLPGLPSDRQLVLQEFGYPAEGRLELVSGESIPERMQIQQALDALLVPVDQPEQRMAVQSQSRAMMTAVR